MLPTFARAWRCAGRQQLTRLLNALSCFPSKDSVATRWLSVSMTTCLAATWSACLHWKKHCESKESRQTLLACLTQVRTNLAQASPCAMQIHRAVDFTALEPIRTIHGVFIRWKNTVMQCPPCGLETLTLHDEMDVDAAQLDFLSPS